MSNCYRELTEILSTEYGVGVVAAPVYVVLWAAERMETRNAKIALKKANAVRTRHGAMIVYVPYGHRLF